MEYNCEKVKEFLVLEPEDWTEDEWAAFLKLFGLKEAERIKISDYTLEFYGTKKTVISAEQWDEAIKILDRWIVEYASIGFAGSFALNGVLVPLKQRYERGERTQELYDEIMAVE